MVSKYVPIFILIALLIVGVFSIAAINSTLTEDYEPSLESPANINNYFSPKTSILDNSDPVKQKLIYDSKKEKVEPKKKKNPRIFATFVDRDFELEPFPNNPLTDNMTTNTNNDSYISKQTIYYQNNAHDYNQINPVTGDLNLEKHGTTYNGYGPNSRKTYTNSNSNSDTSYSGNLISKEQFKENRRSFLERNPWFSPVLFQSSCDKTDLNEGYCKLRKDDKRKDKQSFLRNLNLRYDNIKKQAQSIFTFKSSNNKLELTEPMHNVLRFITSSQWSILQANEDIQVNTGFDKVVKFQDNSTKLILQEDEPIFIYEQALDLSSSISNNELIDLTGALFPILGDDYMVINSRLEDNELKLNLLDVIDVQEFSNNESKQVHNLKIKVRSIQEDKAVIEINNQTISIDVGQVKQFNESKMTLITSSKVNGLAKFAVGKKTLELKDKTNDDVFSISVKQDNQEVIGALVSMIGDEYNDIFTLRVLRYKVLAGSNEDIKLTKGNYLSNHVLDNRSLLSLDIKYEGLKLQDFETIQIKKHSNHFKLYFTNENNINYSIPIAAQEGNSVLLGQHATTILALKEGIPIRDGDYFISSPRDKPTLVLNVKDINDKKVEITHNNENFTVEFEDNSNLAELNLNDRSLTVKKDNQTIKIDLNDDGYIGSEQMDIKTKEGIIELNDKSSHIEFNLITLAEKLDDQIEDEIISLKIENDLSINDLNGVELFEKDDISKGISRYGVTVESEDDKVTFLYPEQQRFPLVSIIKE